MRIVFTTWGSLGDLHPYMALALELKRRGHETAIATLPAWRDHVIRAGIGFHLSGPDVPSDEQAARELVRRVLDAKNGAKYLFEEVLGPYTRQSYADVLAAVRADGGADLLISHQVPITASLVAETTGMKWISGVLLPMSFLSAFDPGTPPQAPWLQPVAALHPAVAAFMTRLGKRATRSWGEPVERLRKELGLRQGAHPIFEGHYSPALVLGLFSRMFGEKQPDFPPQTLVTGFSFYDAAGERPPSDDLLRFLDAGEPPILFTLGSSAVWIAGDFYRTSIDAARALGRRALLLVGEDAAGFDRGSLPEGIGVFDYAPHSLVMPRASVIVHQGGVGTTAQALRAGRPMLVVPFGQDQPDNGRRSVRLGVGRTLQRSRYTTARLVAELSNLISDRSYARRASEVGDFVRRENGTTTACDAIERVLSS
jgi:rhamnosyltransferase subunit B